MKLQGKVAVVTGGLRGIGHAIALALAQEGADLLRAGLSMDRAASTEQEIRALGRRCMVVQADVAFVEAASTGQEIARTPARQLGLPADVGKAAVFLASEDSAYITGTTLVLDGGVMAVW